MSSRFFHRLPLQIVLTVVTRPRLTLVVAGLLLFTGVLLGVFRLPLSSDQNKLFSRDVPFFRQYLQFVEKFPENEAVYVVVEAADASPPPVTGRWTAAADAIAAKLRAMPEVVRRVYARVPSDQLGDQGLLYERAELIPARLAEVNRFLPMVRIWAEQPPGEGPPAQRFLNAMLLSRFAGLVGQKQSPTEAAPFVGVIAESWGRSVNEPALPLVPGKGLPDLELLGAQSPRDLGYFFVPDETDRSRNLLLIQVYPKQNYSSLTGVSETVEAIRGAVAGVAGGYPEFRVGITGRPALEADEMRTTDRDSTRSEIVALSAVFIGLVVMFRSLWRAVAATIALCTAIGITFGWAAIAVGELNLLSIVFFIALIGIGMDYLVQVLSRYRVEVVRRGSVRTVWIAVFRQVAAPITTACLGAAGAFLVAYFTPFQGAADLGVIAGGGLLICLACGYTVLPALLTVFVRKRSTTDLGMEVGAVSDTGFQPVRIDQGVGGRESPERGAQRTGWKPVSLTEPSPRLRRYILTPLLWLVGVLALLPFAIQARFDAGLLGLQAPNLPSVQLVRKLQTWSAVVLSSDLETLRRARSAIADSPEVAGTESILDAYDARDWLAKNAGQTRQVQWSEPAAIVAGDVPKLVASLKAVAGQFEAAGKTAPPAERPAVATAAGQIRAAADRLDAAVKAGQGDAAAVRLSAWQSAFVGQLRGQLATFNPGPVRVEGLPPELKGHLVADDGTYALYIYPKQDLWQREHLQRFVTDIEKRSAAATGVPPPTGIAVNILHSTESVQRSFLTATAYALGLIVLLVLLDLRNLPQTLLAISVLAFGLPMLIGLMSLLDVSWNLANFFGLPILIGAGHEYGVFMVHRYREALKHKHRAWIGWDTSDWALLMCGYVTSASFAFFWLMASHRGLKSLGLVMALGTACIYLATVFVLRPILKWRLSK
ncbi:MMPL family transporter [Humisphaera borealis]|uniref:MMPL family transporter n=1 Tax=Humisphaera borealis TaxID=2807512 RepID=A0A7M2WVJ7_9BACT|nr:MMPL family transporter [Humisphaera borealis]QOV89409.1 MMPL family transporter [Humisphaera borealis]